MKKILNKMLSAAIAAVISVNALASAAGAANYDTDTYLNKIMPQRAALLGENPTDEELERVLREYADVIVPSYVNSTSVPDSYDAVYGDFYITDIIPQYDWENGGKLAGYFVFIAYKGEMIGQLVIRYNSDLKSISSTYYIINDPEIHKVLTDGTPFQLGCGYGCFYLYADGRYTIIDSDFSSPTETDFLKADPDKTMTAGYDYAKVETTLNYSRTKITEGGGKITERDVTVAAKYFSDDNNYKYGWNIIDGKDYYIKPNGKKATKGVTIDNIRYKFSADGVCEGRYSGWTKSSKGLRYYKNGMLLKHKWIKTKSGARYYVDYNGYTVTGSYTVDGVDYSFDENGKLIGEYPSL